VNSPSPTFGSSSSNSHEAARHGAPLSRRLFLGGSASALAAGLVLPAFGRKASAPASARAAGASLTAEITPASAKYAEALAVLGATTLRAPGSLPFPNLAAGTDTLPGIEHIVVLMLENHSYDNFFGMLGRGDGFTLGSNGLPTATNPYANGDIQHAFHMPTTCQNGTVTQEWQASHTQYDNGKLDGFVITSQAEAMGYWTGEDLPFTYSLANAFPIGDRWFCSVLGQTDPNRRYLIAGTSAGMTDDGGVSLVNFIEPAPNGTIFNLLDKYGISWENYVYSSPLGATPELYAVNDLLTEAVHSKAFDDFFSDAASGSLPAFSLLDPNYDEQSQENPQNIVVGEALLSQVVNAIGASPLWPSTLFILVYDEHGGYYDHVPPPAAIAPDTIAPLVQPGQSAYDGFARYGFRVPSVVVSPYAKPGYVTSVVHDHTSILATLERKWNLPALTYRDANANDVTDFLDLNALAAGRPTFPALPALAAPGDTTAALACSTTGPGTIPPAGSVTSG
jgi:phospholipase C